jgi:UDP-glucose 4-epimerase
MKTRNTLGFKDHPACTYIEKDLLDIDLDSIIENTDVIFHLAAQAGVRASWGPSFDDYTHLNVTVLQRLLEAAKHSGVSKFVFASSSSVYGDAEAFPTTEEQILKPVSPYGATKALGENLVYLYHRNLGLPTVSLRYFSVFGPRQRPDMAFHRAIEAGLDGVPFTLYGDGLQTRDFTFVGDIVDATISAAERGVPGAIYNIGGGSRISMVDALSLIQAQIEGLTVEHLDSQPGDARNTAADITAAVADLGYSPKTSVAEGLLEQAAWHRSIRDPLTDLAVQ